MRLMLMSLVLPCALLACATDPEAETEYGLDEEVAERAVSEETALDTGEVTEEVTGASTEQEAGQAAERPSGEFDPARDVDPAAAEAAAATYCFLPSNPPNAQNIGLNSTVYVANYGTGACSSYVVGAQHAGSITARAYGTPTTAAACVGTAITVRPYLKNSGVWTMGSPVTETGVWTITGCRKPSVTINTSADEVRIDVRVKRTVCSGQLCGTTYGLPFTAVATYQVPS